MSFLKQGAYRPKGSARIQGDEPTRQAISETEECLAELAIATAKALDAIEVTLSGIADSITSISNKLSFVIIGTGDPDTVQAAAVGALFLRSDGGTGTTLYVKETGTDTATGWVAK